MNEQKNQIEQGTPFFKDLQNEVSAESAPLLQFITRHASLIAGVVICLLLLLGGMAIWNWYQGRQLENTRQELARINQEFSGQKRVEELARLAENAPDKSRMFIYMHLADNAREAGDHAKATDAYARASALDGDGAMGMAAVLGNAGSLLKQGEYAAALTILQKLAEKTPIVGQSVQFQQLLAEAALKAGNRELASKTYENLANTLKNAEQAYFRSRVENLRESATTGEKPASVN